MEIKHHCIENLKYSQNSAFRTAKIYIFKVKNKTNLSYTRTYHTNTSNFTKRQFKSILIQGVSLCISHVQSVMSIH